GAPAPRVEGCGRVPTAGGPRRSGRRRRAAPDSGGSPATNLGASSAGRSGCWTLGVYATENESRLHPVATLGKSAQRHLGRNVTRISCLRAHPKAELQVSCYQKELPRGLDASSGGLRDGNPGPAGIVRNDRGD